MLQPNRSRWLFGPLLSATVLVAAACAGEQANQEQEAAPEPAAEMMESQEAGGMEGMGQAPHGEVSMINYRCADGGMFTLTVAPGVGQAALRLADGEVFQLDQIEAASGMEFSDGTYTFRGKGPEAFVERDGEQILTDCMAAGHPQ
jgi:membrane-bound inhibitor of C-type lysozyme